MFVTKLVHNFLPFSLFEVLASSPSDLQRLSPVVRQTLFFLESLQAHWMGSARLGESLQVLRREEITRQAANEPGLRDYSWTALKGLQIALMESHLFPRLIFEAERVRAILEVTFGTRKLHLFRELQRTGFLGDGMLIREFHDHRDAIQFLGILEQQVGPGEDLMDILERLEFEWQTVKGINATLRSMATYRERYADEPHPKFMAFEHPMVHRAVLLGVAASFLRKEQKTLEEVRRWVKERGEREGYTLEVLLDRSEVESYIIDRFLEHPDWLESLLPGLSTEGMKTDRVRIARRNEELKASVAYLRFFATISAR